jgi:predicted ferric reductase
MSYSATLTILALALAVTVFANLRARRPPELGRIRWLPYSGLQFVGILVIILMLAHLVTLSTGRPFVGRGGF